MKTLTSEDIEKHYSALLDSVSLIEKLEASKDSDEETLEIIDRNKAHLKMMLAQPYWTNQDMTSVEQVLE